METLPWTRWLGVMAIASIPGLLLLGLVVATLARALRSADDLDADSLLLRRPLPSRLAEQRFANVVGEMAVAASITEPRVLVTERASPNAVVLGADAAHVTIVVSRSLLELLDRDEMQGVAAHLVATIANGDVRAGARVALSLGLFGLITRLTGAILDRDAAQLLPSLVLAALRPGTARARALLAAIANPFGGDVEESPRPSRRSGGSDSLTWREWAAMPFTGPLVMSGFFGGLVSSFVLAPLVALAWRQRKYLADSTAVRLTRNPDTLAEALQKIGPERGATSFAPWAAHLAVVQDGPVGRGGSLLSSSTVPMFPGLERRLKALVRQGATVTVVEKKVPPLAWLIGVPVGLLLAALMSTVIVLLLWVSLALSGLFTLLPFGALNLFLRWLGG
jgi:Zn-dependent protease with chaperone function